MGFLASPPQGRSSAACTTGRGKRDELLAFFIREVAGLPPDQVELMRSLPAWEARLAVVHTIPREEHASREYAFDPDRFRGLSVPTLRAARVAVEAALPDCRVAVMPGQRHAAMDTGTDLFVGEVLSFLDA